VVGLVTEAFHDFAQQLLDQRNAGALPLAVVAHPVGGIARAQAAARITGAVLETVIAALQREGEP
jgi:hypothetical protein